MGILEGARSWISWMSKQDENATKRKHFPNLGEDINQVVHNPEFERVLNSTSPYLLASLGAWPGYWIYRGLDYHSHRAFVPLPMYIRQVSDQHYSPPNYLLYNLLVYQTFYQAKLLQMVIIMAGIIHFMKGHNTSEIFTKND